MSHRGAGILLPIFSLPSRWAIGDFGGSARNFVDWLAQAGQSYWQILPLTPTEVGLGNSPYSSISTFACSPLLISLDDLANERFLEGKDLSPPISHSQLSVNYEQAQEEKLPLLKKAFYSFLRQKGSDPLLYFLEEQEIWLKDFALFVTLRRLHNNLSWNCWPEPFRFRSPQALKKIWNEYEEEIFLTIFIQFIAYSQMNRLKNYCQKHNICLIGDLPIYVSYDSADVWSHPEFFQLDSQLKPEFIAGVPPDYFSSTGQRWGNPLYKWILLKEDNFQWWMKRISYALNFFHILRIDHFRGLIAYWSIPSHEKTAVHGHWEQGEGESFLSCLKKNFPSMPFVAENLGIITPDVTAMMKKYELPGMLVLLFAFDSSMPQNPYILHNHRPENIVYTGTHDNNTARGWFEEEALLEEKKRLITYTGQEVISFNVASVFIRMALMSVASVAIIPMQDILNLGSSSRINTPSLSKGNWEWRVPNTAFTEQLSSSLFLLSQTYGRT